MKRRYLWSSQVDLYTDDDLTDEQADDVLNKFDTDWDATMAFLQQRVIDGGYLETWNIDEQAV